MPTVVFNSAEEEWIYNDIQRQLNTNRAIDVGGGQLKMLIVNETNNKVLVPYAPQEISHSDIGTEWGTSARAGSYSVFRRTGMNTPTMSFDLTLAALGSHGKGNITGYLNAFDIMSEQGQRVYVHYTSREQGAWLITGYSAQVTHRSPDHQPTRATVSLTFSRVMNEQAFLGPINGGSSVLVPPPAPASTATPAAGTSLGTYKVKKGDTLWDIATKYYGKPLKWTVIADKNGIKNPRRLQIGTVLTIPKI